MIRWAEIGSDFGGPIGGDAAALIEAQFRSQAPAPIAAAARAVAAALNKPALAFAVADKLSVRRRSGRRPAQSLSKQAKRR